MRWCGLLVMPLLVGRQVRGCVVFMCQAQCTPAPRRGARCAYVCCWGAEICVGYQNLREVAVARAVAWLSHVVVFHA